MLLYILLFICLPVGGIYTVIKTKAAETVAEYGEQFFMFGPYNEKCAKLEVEVIETPTNYAIADTITQMKTHGLKVCKHCAA